MSMQNKLQPGDLVLVRSLECHSWELSHYGYKKERHYYCSNGCNWRLCIPFKGNEHLLGTSDNPEMPQKEKSYVERQKEWIEKTGCKQDSVVMITRQVETGENGWYNHWNNKMTEKVNQYGIIGTEVTGGGILVKFGDCEYYFPYFCLKVVRP